MNEYLRLYLVTDRRLCGNRPLEEVVKKAIDGGVTAVQIREKECSAKEFYEIALRVKKVIPKDVPLIINDRLDIALACEASGIHLGQKDIFVEIARKHLGEDAIIGLSIENMEQLKKANTSLINYIAISPVFATTTKKDVSLPWGIEGLIKARKETNLPIVAIGGINENNVDDVFGAGVDGVAVVSAICASSDPEEMARKLRR